MTVIKKGAVARPVRKKETFPVPEFDGDVIVMQMTLTQYVDFATNSMPTATAEAAPPEETLAAAAPPVWRSSLAAVLAECVVDADGKPIFDAAEWEVWGACHRVSAFALWDKVKALTNLDVETVAKN